MTRRRRLVFSGVSPTRGGAAPPHPSDGSPTDAAAAAHGTPVTGREDQAVNLARIAPSPGKSPASGRNAAHCPGRQRHPRA